MIYKIESINRLLIENKTLKFLKLKKENLKKAIIDLKITLFIFILL